MLAHILLTLAWLLPLAALLPFFVWRGASRPLWLVSLEVFSVGAFLLCMLATFVYPCFEFSAISSNTPFGTYQTPGCLGISGFLAVIAMPLEYLLVVLVLVTAIFESVRARRGEKRLYAALWSAPGIIILEVLAFFLLLFGTAFFA